ncbi:hypothetical protein B0H11DRAFT_2182416 [Mycena galericulata]|nr:hypothetical protein B0H11DRAFT_2182416 [Mycena galericulata]
MAQAKARPSQAKANYFGLAWDFSEPKPLQAGPKPWLSGQAKARTSLTVPQALLFAYPASRSAPTVPCAFKFKEVELRIELVSDRFQQCFHIRATVRVVMNFLYLHVPYSQEVEARYPRFSAKFTGWGRDGNSSVLWLTAVDGFRGSFC